jgi:alpha-galactosidase
MFRNGKLVESHERSFLTKYRAAPLGNSWRMSNDIFNAWRAIWRITNQAVAHSKYNGPGAFADLDMLM